MIATKITHSSLLQRKLQHLAVERRRKCVNRQSRVGLVPCASLAKLCVSIRANDGPLLPATGVRRNPGKQGRTFSERMSNWPPLGQDVYISRLESVTVRKSIDQEKVTTQNSVWDLIASLRSRMLVKSKNKKFPVLLMACDGDFNSDSKWDGLPSG